MKNSETVQVFNITLVDFCGLTGIIWQVSCLLNTYPLRMFEDCKYFLSNINSKHISAYLPKKCWPGSTVVVRPRPAKFIKCFQENTERECTKEKVKSK